VPRKLGAWLGIGACLKSIKTEKSGFAFKHPDLFSRHFTQSVSYLKHHIVSELLTFCGI